MSSSSLIDSSSLSLLISICSGVEKDLQEMQTEFKRYKSSSLSLDMGTSIERASQRTKAIAKQCQMSRTHSSESFTVMNLALQHEDLLKPVLLSTALRSVRMSLAALSCMRRLLGLTPLSSRFVASIISALRAQADQEEGEVQLKVLQTLLLCIAPASLQCGEILTGSLLQALSICIKLHSVKNPITKVTASAALKQLCMLLFDRVQAASSAQSSTMRQQKRLEIEYASGTMPDEMKSNFSALVVSDETKGLTSLGNVLTEHVNAFLLFRDLVILAQYGVPDAQISFARSQPKWLSGPASASLCLELLESTLACNKDLYFEQEPSFFVLLKRDMCVMLVRMLRISIDMSIVARLMRCALVIIRQNSPTLCRERDALLTIIIKLLRPEFALWQHICTLEAMQIILGTDPAQAYTLFVQFDDTGKHELMGSLCTSIATFVAQASAGDLMAWRPQNSKQRSIRLLERAADEDMPHLEDAQKLSLSVEIIVHIVNSCSSLVSSFISTCSGLPEAGEGASNTTATLQGHLIELHRLKSFVLSNYGSWLTSLSSLLAQLADEAAIQHILLAYQSLTNTCGVLQLTKPRNDLLTSLCSFATRKSSQGGDLPTDLLRDALASDGEGRTVPLLTPKNVQAIKALFNIAHCLGSYLGSAWNIVLSTFQSLDVYINLGQEIQKLTITESVQVQETLTKLLPLQSEMDILSSALTRLFESTSYLDDNAVTQILSALGALSLSVLAASQDGMSNSSASPRVKMSLSSIRFNADTTPRLFGLQNLIATIEHNLFRLFSANLWELGMNHLTCCITHRETKFRAYGIDALKKLVMLALNSKDLSSIASQRRHAARIEEFSVVDNANSVKSSTNDHVQSTNGTRKEILEKQRLILLPMMELYSTTKYADSRAQLLLNLHQILQSCGAILNDGWIPVLEWLSLVCEIPSAPLRPNETVERTALVGSGFQSIQLIVNDFIDALPLHSIALLISCITAYCSQNLDTNVSFTSIGLLWRVSDYIARIVGVPKQRSPTTSQSLPAIVSTSGQELDLLSEAAADRLMLLLFTKLYVLATDLRSEVRNSAVKTFSSTVVAHGSRMRADACLEVLRAYELPLLVELMQDDANKERESSIALQGRELGKDKDSGKTVMMMVHHSRDSAEKQWDETRVFALQGSSRVLRVYLENWSTLSEFSEQLWPAYLQVLSSAVAHRSTEVSLAAVSAYQELTSSPACFNVFLESNALFIPILLEFDNIIKKGVALVLNHADANNGTGDTGQSDNSFAKHWLKVYTQFLLAFLHLVSNRHGLIDDQQLRQMFQQTLDLATVALPSTLKSGANFVVDSESTVQAAALRLVDALSPLDSSSASIVVDTLSAFVRKWSVVSPSIHMFAFTRKSLLALDSAFSRCISSLQYEHLWQILAVLKEVVASSKFLSFMLKSGSSEECREIITCAQHLIEVGLAAQLQVNGSIADIVLAEEIVQLLARFLDPEQKRAQATQDLDIDTTVVHKSRIPAEQQFWEQIKITVVELLARSVLPSTCTGREWKTAKQSWQLVQLLNVGWECNMDDQSTPNANELLSHACLVELFSLVGAAYGINTSVPPAVQLSTIRVACVAAPLLLQRCETICLRYAFDQRALPPGVNMKRARAEELAFVLRELVSLKISSALTDMLRARTSAQRWSAVRSVGSQLVMKNGTMEADAIVPHLYNLRFALCECVVVENSDIRELVRALFFQLMSSWTLYPSVPS